MTTVAAIAPAPTTDYVAIKAKQNAIWSSGDYSLIGTTLQLAGESLAEALDLRSDQRVLDVAAGNGNFTLAAARRGADVVSTDYVRSLLENGRLRADAERLAVEFQVADAEELPFTEASFDVVGSTFGVMFAPNQDQAAAEMVRVCRSGGRIGLANWTPDGFIGTVLKTVGQYVPPPAGLRSPALWGTRSHLDALFGRASNRLDIAERQLALRYRSPEQWLAIFRTYYGPMLKAFAALDAEAGAALGRDLLDVVARFNLASDGTMVAPSTYLEVVITRR